MIKLKDLLLEGKPKAGDYVKTVYGIGNIVPGDCFKVDYLPERYLKEVYFQVMKVSHNITGDGWYTTFETQFRTRSTSPTENIFTDLIKKETLIHIKKN